MIAVSHITSGVSRPASNAGNTVWLTGTFTPTAHSLLVTLHSASTATTFVGEAAMVVPTITGFGSLWTSLQSSVMTGALSAIRSAGVQYTQIGANPSADSVRFSFSTTQLSFGWVVDQVTGQHQTTPIVQSVVSKSPSNSSMTVILSAFGSAANGTYAAFYIASAGVGTLGTGLVALSQASGSPNQTLCSGWTSVNTTTPWAGFNSSTNSISGFGVELAISAGAPGYYRRRLRL